MSLRTPREHLQLAEELIEVAGMTDDNGDARWTSAAQHALATRARAHVELGVAAAAMIREERTAGVARMGPG